MRASRPNIFAFLILVFSLLCADSAWAQALPEPAQIRSEDALAT
jgi:hypothetical protein